MTVKKRSVLLWVLSLGIIFLSGCETAKGAACGIGTTVAGTAEGAAKDTGSLWQAILNADAWMRKNLW